MTRCGPRNLPRCCVCHRRVPKDALVCYTAGGKAVYLCNAQHCTEAFEVMPINPPRKSGRLD